MDQTAGFLQVAILRRREPSREKIKFMEDGVSQGAYAGRVEKADCLAKTIFVYGIEGLRHGLLLIDESDTIMVTQKSRLRANAKSTPAELCQMVCNNDFRHALHIAIIGLAFMNRLL